jgi:hypothetical protein
MCGSDESIVLRYDRFAVWEFKKGRSNDRKILQISVLTPEAAAWARPIRQPWALLNIRRISRTLSAH